MKQKYFFITLLFFTTFNLAAQSGLMQSALNGRNTKDVTGQKWVGVQTNLALNISTVLGGGKIILPPTFFRFDYGAYKNFTIGGLLGLTSTQSAWVDVKSFSSLLSSLQESACSLDSATASGIGIDCTYKSGQVKYTTTYVLLGASGKYFVQAGPKTDLYGNFTIGYKMGSNKKSGTTNGTYKEIDAILGAYNTASNIFVGTTVGAHFYLDKQNKFAITGEGGYGYGWGNDIVIGTQAIIIGIGATMHFGH